MRRLLLLVSLLASPALALTADSPRPSLVPGGIVVLDLGRNGEDRPLVTYHGQRVLTHANATGWQAIVGIPLSASPGEDELQVTWGEEGPIARHFFEIVPKEYPTQHITIKNRRMVNPNAQDLERIARERERKRRAKASWSATDPQLVFLQPVDGQVSGSFGRRRVFNGQPRSPHSGMDIAAPLGTPVKAPAAGRVVEVGDFFFSGNVVYIEHGQGLVTLYAHLNHVDVEKGQQVQAGQVIGTVGATGRVTGPHLHWSVGLNNTWVDPALFLPPASPGPTTE
jgi:murein DD-endopeptidase MepM/ murein hydrolase activator NlpD